MEKLLVEGYDEIKRSLLARLTDLHELAVVAADPKLREISAGLIKNVESPYLFVVVGEVKAGKSSFVNALLGIDVCAVAPDPCTDTIQKIVYSETPFEREVREHLREFGRPHDILKDVAIVDTPGTNSIIDTHQEITEEFVPESDLIIFVLPALNPYPKTMWDFLGFIHKEWHKKIIFVMQQADRATEHELAVNEKRVAEYAREKGIAEPRIFRVSAKLTMEGQGGGMEALWAYIRETVTGGRHLVLKLESLLGTGLSVLDKIDAELSGAKAVLESDTAQSIRIRKRLELAHGAAEREIEALKARLALVYDETANEITESFEDGLGMGTLLGNSVKGIFGKRGKHGFEDWLRGLGARFNERLSERTATAAREAAGNVAQVFSVTMEDVAEMLKANGGAPFMMGRDTSLMERRLEAVNEVVDNVASLLESDELSGHMRPGGLKSIGDQTFMGGFLATIGAVIAAATPLAVVDITGGVVTTLGLALLVNSIAFKRRSIIRNFRKALAEGRKRFVQDLDERLTIQLDSFNRRLTTVFEPFFADVEARERDLASLSASSEKIRVGLEDELLGARSLLSGGE